MSMVSYYTYAIIPLCFTFLTTSILYISHITFRVHQWHRESESGMRVAGDEINDTGGFISILLHAYIPLGQLAAVLTAK